MLKILFEKAGEPKKLEMIKNTDHQYMSPENKVDEVIELTINWFKSYL
jgi:dipeptidyl aminopeptidase/acylaminoacyl peptidase